jgi:hypothetical protein
VNRIKRSSHRAPPANATFAKNMAAVTEREYGDRVGILAADGPVRAP